MTKSLLGTYQSLVEEHSNRFSPLLAHLRQSINQQVDALRQQEQNLLNAQIEKLKRIERSQWTPDVYCR